MKHWTASISFIGALVLVVTHILAPAQINAQTEQSSLFPLPASPLPSKSYQSMNSIAREKDLDRTLARNEHRVTVAIATRNIPRGVTLQAGDFAMVDTVIVWRWSGKPELTLPRVGWITQRAIATGEILQSPGVTPAPVVTSGSNVTAIWQDRDIRLVLTGIATNSAARGEAVGVRIDRLRRLDGIAVAPDTIRLR